MRFEDVASAQQNDKGTSQAFSEGGPQNDSGQSTQEPVRDSWTSSPSRWRHRMSYVIHYVNAHLKRDLEHWHSIRDWQKHGKPNKYTNRTNIIQSSSLKSPKCNFKFFSNHIKNRVGTSLVVQGIRICPPGQETLVQSLIREDPRLSSCTTTTGPVL